MADLPRTMTVIAIRAPGGPEVLTPEERPLPVPAEREILVRVRVAGLNRPDILQRQGSYPPPPGAPDIPGLEMAGEVVAVGPAVTRFRIGDAVTGLVPGGGYAEFCKIHETNALPVPRGFSMIEAAAIPETYFTVWPNLFERARLVAGETVLIHGGASGIGTTAIQIARAFGARVIATAGNAAHCAACLRLGAQSAIDYHTEDFVARVGEITGGHGADVILDMVGGDYVRRNYAAAAEDGRIVQIAVSAGALAETDFHVLMRKRLTHTGSTLRNRSIAFKAALLAEVETKLWPLLARRAVVPVIDTTFPLERAAEAHARLEGPSHIGKIVLTVA